MKYTRYYFLWFVIVTAVTISLTACHKDPSKVGFNIQPDSDKIELYSDDSTVLFVSYTIEHDSISTSGLETLVLGSINDPVFGSTQAAFNTQFRLSQVNPFFGKDVTFDSICLHLGYTKDGLWGDSITFMTANVYVLTDSLWLNSDTTAGATRDNYYATDVIGFDPVPIGTKTFLPQPFDSVETKRFWLKNTQDMHAPFISIKLDDKFGQDILNDTAALISNDDFLKSFYGLHVDVTPIEGAFGKMLYFNSSSPETRLVLYYTNSDSSASYSFVIDNKSSLRFNEYKTDHSTACADLQNQLAGTSPEVGNQRLYLQPLNGVRIKVNFSGIEKLREKKNIAINEAKLYLNNAEDYDKTLPPVKDMTMMMYSSKYGKEIVTPDSELGMQYFGGKFDASKNRYVMRITRYLQKRILNPDMDDDNIYISITGASFIANRVVLFGNNPDDEPEQRAKIRILYSEY